MDTRPRSGQSACARIVVCTKKVVVFLSCGLACSDVALDVQCETSEWRSSLPLCKEVQGTAEKQQMKIKKLF